MQNDRQASDDPNEDLYSGYDYDSVAVELEEDPEFKRVVKTGYATRPPMPTQGGGMRTGGLAGYRMATPGRLMTGVVPTDTGQARPMTGVTAAGFSSTKYQPFDPLSQAVKAGPGMDKKADTSPQAVIKKLEQSVNQLIEESTLAAAAGDYQKSLDLAQEAGRKERLLCKQREQANLSDQINYDLTYCVLFNIGNQYYVNSNFRDALKTYLMIVKNKTFSTGSRLRVNMGNIYMDQKKYPQAIKNYRMALDQTSEVHNALRLKILHNTGIAFVRMGRYPDAITSFEAIMDDEPNFKTALNLLLCYYAISDREKMKNTFLRTLAIKTGIQDEDRYYLAMEDDTQQRLLVEAIKDDSLRKIEKQNKLLAEKTILTTAKLIAPIIESSFAVGFDWCIENVMDSSYSDMASELEITKGITYLKQSDITRAIETFKDCEKRDSKMAGTAATNLAFIYILDSDIPRADKYAENAISIDHYNPHGLVNKGCCLYMTGNYEKAAEYFQEALNVEATCCEALFNLGLVYKKMEHMHKAMETFVKLHAILKNSPQVIYHLADLYDKMDDFNQATEWFMQLVTLVPTDPHVLQRLGAIYEDANDQSQAYQYKYESFRYCPTNIDVISWLGAYHMNSQYADKAIQYFEKAALIQPTQINWHLMVASCHRKIGNYQQALQSYKQIHIKFPDNIDCLRFLVKFCSDLGLKEIQDYSIKLKKAEKLLDSKKQSELSRGSPSQKDSAAHRQSIDKAGTLSGGVSQHRDHDRFRVAGERPTSAGSVEPGTSTDSVRKREIDVTYKDPLGALPPRPMTGMARPYKEDDFNEEELIDDLLPD